MTKLPVSSIAKNTKTQMAAPIAPKSYDRAPGEPVGQVPKHGISEHLEPRRSARR